MTNSRGTKETAAFVAYKGIRVVSAERGARERDLKIIEMVIKTSTEMDKTQIRVLLGCVICANKRATK